MFNTHSFSSTMKYHCSVLGCLKTSNNRVRLHKFPFDNQTLLPIWVMAVNRIDWIPDITSRICDRHFNIDDYEDGNKNNNLIPIACPLLNNLSNSVENDNIMTDSDNSVVDLISTGDVNCLDIDIPNTSDMVFNNTDLSEDSNSKQTRRINNNFPSAISNRQTEGETTNVRNTNLITNTAPLSSTITTYGNIHWINHINDYKNNDKCAVVFCKKKYRPNFEQLFFVDFPKNKKLCKIWWRQCGRYTKFDSSYKICSIHFRVNDFTTFIVEEEDNQLSQRSVLRNKYIVPSKFVLYNEYKKLIKRQKKSIKTMERNKSTEILNCLIQGCSNTSLQNDKSIFFFKFPLENKVLLLKWLKNIGVLNWKISDTDVICSEHFEYYNLNQIDVSDKEFSNCDNKLQKHPTLTIKAKTSKDPSLNSEHDITMLGDSSGEGKGINFVNLNKDNLKVNKNVGENSIINDSPRNKINHKQIVTTTAIQSDLTERNAIKGIPISIINDSGLIECYGEMLPAMCDCQLKCSYSIPGPQRKDIYNKFQMLNSVTEQNCEITQLVKLQMIKNRDDKFECCPLYYLIMNNLTVMVCRSFFINTLGIPDHRLNSVLKPINYSWYSDKETALKANLPKQVKVISDSVEMTDFMKESLKLLDKDCNLYEHESDSEVNLDNVPDKEYEKVFAFIKSIPRVLTSCIIPGGMEKQFFETSIDWNYIYEKYSENYIQNNVPTPYTKRQFKKIYNQYMKPI